jgi:hypothetical protein
MKSITKFWMKVSFTLALSLSIFSDPSLAGCRPGETKYIHNAVISSAYAGGCWVDCNRDEDPKTYTAPRGWVISSYTTGTRRDFGRNDIKVSQTAAETNYSSDYNTAYGRTSSTQVSAGTYGNYGYSQNSNSRNSQQFSVGSNLASITLTAWAEGIPNFRRTGSSRSEALHVNLVCVGDS